MSEAISTELSKLENDGVAHLKEFIIVVSPLLCIVADNPRASEILNHLGGCAHRYCRMCMVSRTVQCTCICILYNLYYACILYVPCTCTCIPIKVLQLIFVGP